jgi:hypothetical protein
MAVYAIMGKLGSGKGKAAIFKLRESLRAGKRVATNCDVFMEHLGDKRSRLPVIRCPDKPTATDLYMLGSGNPFIKFDVDVRQEKTGLKGYPPTTMEILPGFDESYNGALLLDECASWLNTRTFAEKGRADLLEWMIHARKYGWDVYFIMQNISQIDKQLRDSLFEYVVRLTRLDRMRIPMVSDVLSGLTAGALSGNLPRLHIGVVRLGTSPDSLVADRWVFRGDDLQKLYNTTQVFSDNYPHGTHSLLSCWHMSAKVGAPDGFVGPIRPGVDDAIVLAPRVEPLKPPHPHMTKFLFMALILGSFLGGAGTWYFRPEPVVQAAAKPTATVIGPVVTAMGFIRKGSDIMVILSDGRAVVPRSFDQAPNGDWTAQVDEHLVVKGTRP